MRVKRSADDKFFYDRGSSAPRPISALWYVLNGDIGF